MDSVDTPQRTASVAPPGWSPAGLPRLPTATDTAASPGSRTGADAAAPPGPLTDADAAAPPGPLTEADAGFPTPAAAAAVTPEDAAIRWRLRAATFDNVLVYFAYAILCAAAGWNPLTAVHIVAGSVLAVIYHFAMESHGGQTLGKRRYGIQVVDLSGGPAGPRAIALRSVLRAIDQLPVSYLSGLISMVRTGAHRRQRLGDVVAGTKVVAVDGRAVSRGTPSWYLPGATVVALITAILVLITVLGTHAATPTGAPTPTFLTR